MSLSVLLTRFISPGSAPSSAPRTWLAAARLASVQHVKHWKENGGEQLSNREEGTCRHSLPPHTQTPGRQLEVGPWLSTQGHLHDSSTRQRQAVMDYCSLWLLFTAQSNLGDTHISQFKGFFYFMKNQPAAQA